MEDKLAMVGTQISIMCRKNETDYLLITESSRMLECVYLSQQQAVRHTIVAKNDIK
jgi:hypothetical protein